MPAKYIPGQGFVSSYEQEQEERAQSDGFSIFDEIRPGMSPFELQQLQQEQGVNRQTQQAIDNAPLEPVKPFISGATVTDVLESFPNAGAAMVTDILDLGAGIGDTASEIYRATTDPNYNFNESGEWFNDSNNPWTQFRRNFGGGMGISETYAGEIVSQGLRLATILIPWNWLNPGKYVKVPNQIARLSGTISKIKNAGTRGPGATARLRRIADGTASNIGKLSKSSGAVRATNTALKNDYLTASFKAINDLPEIKSWWQATQKSAQAVLETKLTFKNIAETVAFDMLAGFMIFGEGDDSLDETMFDFAASLGIDIPVSLQTTIEDSSLERKLKGMLDGGLIGFFGGALVDFFRINRYARALKEATPQQRAQIIRAFKEESELLGKSAAEFAEKKFLLKGEEFASSPVQNALANMVDRPGAGLDSTPQSRLDQQSIEGFAKAEPGPLPDPLPAGIDPFDVDGLLLDRVVKQVEEARLKLPGTTSPASLGRPAADGVATPLKNAPYPDEIPGGDPLNVQFDRAGFKRDRDGSLQVRNLGIENVEPTVTPQTIRRAVQDAIDRNVNPRRITAGVQKLLPTRRINQLDYIQSARVDRNQAGVISAADSIWYNAILQRGLNEGWISLDPETFRTAVNRKVALDLDQADLANKAARGIDQAEDAARYEQYLESADPANAGDAARLEETLKKSEPMNPGSMNPAVQADLEIKDAENVASSTEGFVVPEPAVDDGIRQAEEATLQSQGLSDSELQRMADEITASADPDDVIADGLGINARELPAFEVQKVGRQYEVIGPDGEVVENGRYTTKKQAIKRADKEAAAVKEGLLRQAQQQLIDRNGEELLGARFPDPTDGDLTASVKLTESQYKAFQQYLTGDPSKVFKGRTMELSQNQLNEIAGDLRVRLEQGQITGNEARVLRNLVEKLDTAVADLAPEVRRQRAIQQARDNASTFLNHGEYC